MDFKLACLTDIGKKRKNNEDMGYVSKNSHATLLLVCDGMGGHKKGEIASKLIVDSISNDFKKRKIGFNPVSVKKFSKIVLKKANKTVHKKSLENNEFREMGSTAVMAIVIKDITFISSIGDSRCYSFSKTKGLKIRTNDQTYVEFLYETGRITKEEKALHPQKNLLLNAVGINPDLSNIQTRTIKNNDYSALLLCSDGLYNMISEEEMTEILSNDSLSTNDKAKTMINLALSHGGSDNITVALMEK